MKKEKLYNLILSIGGGFIVILLSVITYYSQQDHLTNKENGEKLEDINVTMQVESAETDKDIEMLTYKFSNHERRIVILESCSKLRKNNMKSDMKDINIVATRLIKIQNIVFSADQVQIIRAMETAMDKFKVYNKHSRRAILSIIGKESGFKLSSELSYRNTPTDRIRLIFGYKVAKYNDIQLHELKRMITIFSMLFMAVNMVMRQT